MRSITSITTERRCTMRALSGRSTEPIIAQHTPASTVPTMKRASHIAWSAIGGGRRSISVDLVDGGVRRLRVVDDGCGIERDDLALALARFATSKIASLEDLERAGTLGFRGEALASIRAVSRTTLVSRRSGERHAWRIACEGG